MPGRMTRVDRLAASERLAIDLLRASGPRDLDRRLRKGFLGLRQAALAAGMSIPAAAIPYLGADESVLLACLTVLQRKRAEFEINLGRDLRDCLMRCAMQLKGAGAHLDHRNITRSAGPDDALRLESIIAPTAVEQPPGFRKVPGEGTVQNRVLSFVGNRGIASNHELARLGASRQLISRMFRNGLLMRVRFGVYSAVSPGDAARESLSRGYRP
jgi:hypothetical protein